MQMKLINFTQHTGDSIQQLTNTRTYIQPFSKTRPEHDYMSKLSAFGVLKVVAKYRLNCPGELLVTFIVGTSLTLNPRCLDLRCCAKFMSDLLKRV